MTPARRNSIEGTQDASGFGSLLETRSIQGSPVNAWLSKQIDAPDWDDFLRANACGQFQQSSLWAKFKHSGGWDVHRVLLEQDERIIGGFQLLCRGTRFGRAGFLNKGAALATEEPELVAFASDLLARAIRSQKLLATFAQPPDNSSLFPSALARRGFAPDVFMDVISATCRVEVTGPPAEWEQNFSTETRRHLRQAVARGVTVREGDAADIPKFYELMLATCARQGVPPNPSTIEGLRELVDAFRIGEGIRLSFADYQGETVACGMDLIFGDRSTGWKKGWNGVHAGARPNIPLVAESLRAAQNSGCRYYDFAGMNRGLAETLLAGQLLTGEQQHHRDTFHLRFGARPRLLPQALVYWRNPLARFLYAKATGWPWMVSRLGQLGERFGSV